MFEKFANAKSSDVAAKSAAKDRPWLFRTYSGHSSPAESNVLYRKNLARGQTGLSIAFDLPTQMGYDSDHPLAVGEVGKVGVPIGHLGDMETLLDGIPLAEMNTSMTINAPAAWLLALYVAAAERQGANKKALSGTIQNDILKEYLSRGTYIFPPEASMRLTTDVISYTYTEIPKWNPINVCPYHLQEAGATPVQELSFALANAIAILDRVQASGQVPEDDFPQVVGRISFFVNAGLRFVTEMCKMRAFTELWDEITAERYSVAEQKFRRFRYGVQVNSLGLTEQQPENNVYRILLEMLAVTLSKNARARAVQLPAWNEALGLPRPWDQQWSLRLQQIVAHETDLLEFGDLFDGSPVVEAKVEELKQATRDELASIAGMGGAVAAVDYMKRALVESNTTRVAAIEAGEQIVVGVNKFEEGELSPLASTDGSFLSVDPAAETRQIEALQVWRDQRDDATVDQVLADLAAAAEGGDNIMEPSIACAHAGVTTGEWAATLREVFGEYRAPTGVGSAQSAAAGGMDDLRAAVEATSETLGRRIKILVGKPGLDGHSNGAEQIAVRARDAGMEVVYEGIRLTPEEIVAAALQESVHVVGLSVLSGSHVPLVGEVVRRMQDAGLSDIPVIVGGIIPAVDSETLRQAGVSRVYTPKDYDITSIMMGVVEVVAAAQPDAA